MRKPGEKEEKQLVKERERRVKERAEGQGVAVWASHERTKHTSGNCALRLARQQWLTRGREGREGGWRV